MSEGWPGAAARLEGDLVIVEPLAESHRATLRAASADPELWRWVAPAVDSPVAFDRYFDHALTPDDQVSFGVMHKATGEAVGMTRYCSLRRADRGLEIGWTWYARHVWRSGVNVETKLLLLTHAFEQLGCMRVELKTHAGNQRSRDAILALGAQFEGIQRKHRLIERLGVRDSAWYSIVDDEWPEVRKRLRARLARH